MTRDEAFVARAAQEFPALAAALAQPARRRTVLKLMAASLALAGCDPGNGAGNLVPAVVAPPDIVPALPNSYTGANLFGGYAAGIVVTHVMGRPIKVEGNPNHPASLGATSAHGQAMLLDFYDPDRAFGLSRRELPADRQDLLAALTTERARLGADHGAGLRLLTGSVTSPTLARQIDALLAQFPAARWHQWEPISRDAVRAGAVLAYGRPVAAIPRPAAADVIFAIDSDMLASAPGHLAFARALASRRNPVRTAKMSRVYAVEPTPTLVAATADHRFVAGPAELHAGFMAVAESVLQNAAPSGAPAWAAAVAADLKAAHGHALVHVGPDQPAEFHALAHAVNEALGGRGATFDLVEPIEHAPTDQAASLAALIQEMAAGQVDALVILGGNPGFSAPGFAEALGRVRFSLSLAPMPDETSERATWSVPETHVFETWSDARAYDGTITIIQPQALPLHGGMSAHEVLALLGAEAQTGPRDIVRATWQDHADFDGFWHDALANGVAAGSASPPAQVALRPEAARLAPPTPPSQPINLLFRPDPNLWDGRYANNPWLQELPRPLTKLVWDNPLLISPVSAAREKLVNGDVVRITVGTAWLEAPVWIVPGQAAECAVGLLGYGRRVVGTVGTGTGFDFFPLRGGTAPPRIEKTGRHVALASTDHHNPLDAGPRDIVRHGTLAAFTRDPRFLQEEPKVETMYHGQPQLSAQAWGMSIDLNSCIGCNACVLACMAENNVPVVGKAQVLHEREMHWLRIDRYYEGTPEAPDSFFQPMLCMHCEEAPCEVVCPVAATVHDQEGLNVMVYNRCVGTRFCSNNCPYKVRRFNYFAFSHEEHRPPIARNPDVTVRARGVMEKCTFCLQRIAEARIAADRENRPIRDGEVVTACQAACPTRAFSFGNINDAGAEVAKRKQSPLDYAVLAEAATHPRVSYEARIRNANPDLAQNA
ncbi:MAG: 4Fe-4S dicluster domain-containing protein [Acidisphaera sp.]|nr:4Fe-4S dicluster domain-containing protein [Acidisphaera sp.]